MKKSIMKIFLLIVLTLSLSCQSSSEGNLLESTKVHIIASLKTYGISYRLEEKQDSFTFRYKRNKAWPLHGSININNKYSKNSITISQSVFASKKPLIETDVTLDKSKRIIFFQVLYWGQNGLSNDQPHYVIVNVENIKTGNVYLQYFEDHDTDEPVIILKKSDIGILIPLTREQQLKELN